MFESFAAIASILPALVSGADISVEPVTYSEYLTESVDCYDLPWSQQISDCVFRVDTENVEHAKTYYLGAETISDEGNRFLTWVSTGIDYGYDSMTV